MVVALSPLRVVQVPDVVEAADSAHTLHVADADVRPEADTALVHLLRLAAE